jgi:hypothetical protein
MILLLCISNFQQLLIKKLDELQEVVSFTKNGVHSGYHHIRMREEDEPFWITNAPSTFQILINCIFKTFLEKFVSVFFDDILIYNKSWDEHVHHVNMILKPLGGGGEQI